MMGCVFCKIVQKQIPAKIVYEDDRVLAFEDSTPQAPVHILIIPKEHIPTVNDINDSHKELINSLFSAAKKIAEEKNIAQRGYRLVMNTNAEAGQSVFHIHMHILGGRHLAWPPG
ncbi:MAG: histidine triad nucleotide-binding protein [Candidatus Firestonebacteria bacterium RIFOXYC2_FULL_39_67]|nr:MAG: histidine triad nucleotide-binding protein [Candidatus Firestonebacteria bacterium RIFOXYD2_FULL_39_29]OGF57012.1 MAG: histidine triad nucleotide-binding protein [Candidatus Firestonebacteria bacterium RIFOXYC2_FULL_39_67]